MERRLLVLAALAPAMGAAHTPVQVQKLLFLIDQEIPQLINGPVFNFEPYDYGPFDKSIYTTLEALERDGMVEVDQAPGSRWRKYRLTETGQAAGLRALEALDHRASNYIKSISTFVRSLSFDQLISAIYREYPEMKVNSVFRG